MAAAMTRPAGSSAAARLTDATRSGARTAWLQASRPPAETLSSSVSQTAWSAPSRMGAVCLRQSLAVLPASRTPLDVLRALLAAPFR
ncbi:hypothetical protein ACFWY6_01400 [Streptomyces sp. NPDC059037]|uniref:hypothetical protein n=1 Tax=Streptomyces sp. NPDC059037 TaxID=3346710 RepID=UPI003678602D